MLARVLRIIEGLVPGMTLPVSLDDFRGRCILHVSDTPSVFYGDLRRLVDHFCPVFLVHTGDLADDVKVGLHPGEMGLYRKRLKALFHAIGGVPAGHIAIACGNHDIAEDIRKVCKGCLLFEGGGRATICGLDIALGHYIREIPSPPSRFNLYGHDLSSPPPGIREIFLNGVTAVNLIDTETGEIAAIPYPRYVDESRLCRRKRGL
ncbi:MAG TPA: metallophosphoesterase [Synergistales bacterium]|jgi:hypothetical protein|nr:metallophosphoesterase [Synergistales bacterium]HRV71948.1 metallophosphoesterase [Thermovirgaceae bacterium]